MIFVHRNLVLTDLVVSRAQRITHQFFRVNSNVRRESEFFHATHIQEAHY